MPAEYWKEEAEASLGNLPIAHCHGTESEPDGLPAGTVGGRDACDGECRLFCAFSPGSIGFLVFLLYTVVTADHPYSYVYGSLPAKSPARGLTY